MTKKTIAAVMLVTIMSLSACGTETGQGADVRPPEAGMTESYTETAVQSLESTIAGDGVVDKRETVKPTEAETFEQTNWLKITMENGEIIIALEDNPTSRNLITHLPMNLVFQDYNQTEKIAYLPDSFMLVTDEASEGYEPEAGDFALYAPWGNLSLFYQDFRYSAGLIFLGHVQSGMELLTEMEDSSEISLELVEPEPETAESDHVTDQVSDQGSDGSDQ